MLTSTRQLHLWTMLEANPGVTRYCERPTWPIEAEIAPALDFWVMRDGQPVWLALDESARSDSAETSSSADEVVQTVSDVELDRHRVWIQNWLSLLPYLSTCSALNLNLQRAPITDFFAREASFGDVERHFSQIDPIVVRTTVIAELHAGRLFSKELTERPWDRNTRVVRTSGRARHAPH